MLQPFPAQFAATIPSLILTSMKQKQGKDLNMLVMALTQPSISHQPLGICHQMLQSSQPDPSPIA